MVIEKETLLFILSEKNNRKTDMNIFFLVGKNTMGACLKAPMVSVRPTGNSAPAEQNPWRRACFVLVELQKLFIEP